MAEAELNLGVTWERVRRPWSFLELEVAANKDCLVIDRHAENRVEVARYPIGRNSVAARRESHHNVIRWRPVVPARHDHDVAAIGRDRQAAHALATASGWNAICEVGSPPGGQAGRVCRDIELGNTGPVLAVDFASGVRQEQEVAVRADFDPTNTHAPRWCSAAGKREIGFIVERASCRTDCRKGSARHVVYQREVAADVHLAVGNIEGDRGRTHRGYEP